MFDPCKALVRAIKLAGGSGDLAARLGITAQAISQWRQVPPLRVLQVEQITGVPRHELRSDIYPPPATESAPADAGASL